MRHKYWLLLAAIPLLLAGVDVIYWQIASTRLNAGLQGWIDARHAEGWDIKIGRTSTGGWPLAATMTLSNVTMRHAGADLPGLVNWASAGISLSLSLYHPTELKIDLVGPQHLQLGAVSDLIITGETIAGSAGLLIDDTMPLTVRAKGLRLEPAVGGWHLTVGLLNLDAQMATGKDPSRPALAFTVSSEAIALPNIVKWPLGPNISSASAECALHGTLPPPQPADAWASAWRDAGGSLEVSHLAIGWGTLGVTATATLALDDQLQPMGSGNAHVVGYAESLDKLASAGVLTKSAATAAKAVLSLMAGTAEGDQPPAVDVPLTLQYRTLSMRQVPLVRLPELDWPNR